jgi:mRNA-degrading endonuclease toxin of MazEF toxin-antitoxin module
MKDFTQGILQQTSYAKTNRIFTIDKKVIIKKKGTLTTEKIKEIEQKLIHILTN